MEPARIESGAASSGGRSETVWQLVLLLSLVAYFVFLFMSWWVATYVGGDGAPAMTMHISGITSNLGVICVLLAVAMFIATLQATGSKERWLLNARRHLAIALFAFNALALAVTWRNDFHTYGTGSGGLFADSHLGLGGLLAIVASIVILLAALALDAGGLRALSRRTG